MLAFLDARCVQSILEFLKHQMALGNSVGRGARGQWLWEDDVDVPLVEEVASYVIGYGPIEEPFATWSVATTQIALSEAERNALLTNHGSGDLWVKQVGTFANSPATLIAQIT